jgi:hypothetical protein
VPSLSTYFGTAVIIIALGTAIFQWQTFKQIYVYHKSTNSWCAYQTLTATTTFHHFSQISTTQHLLRTHLTCIIRWTDSPHYAPHYVGYYLLCGQFWLVACGRRQTVTSHFIDIVCSFRFQSHSRWGGGRNGRRHLASICRWVYDFCRSFSIVCKSW